MTYFFVIGAGKYHKIVYEIIMKLSERLKEISKKNDILRLDFGWLVSIIEHAKEQEKEIKELKMFIRWYSGMKQFKIDNAYRRFKKEELNKH